MSKDEAAVFDYLEKVNRPYSVNDIVQNFHNKLTKTVVQKAVDQLVSKGKVRVKEYNKQKIYTIKQEKNEGVNVEEELCNLESQILQESVVLANLEKELKSVESELQESRTTITTEEAQRRKTELQTVVNNLETKLASLLSDKKAPITKADRDKIEKEYETALKEYRKRKRICMDIFNSILENYPKSKTALIEDMELEMDDDSNTPPVLRT